MTSTLNFREEVKLIFDQNTIEKHPLFEAIKNNHLSENQIKEIGLQFYQVVLAFPRFISAILTNIDSYEMRMPLVDNLFEEHGRLNHEYVHSETFKKFLLSIGLSNQEINENKPTIPILAYNRAMIDLCLHYNYLEGLSALGVIEEIVARVSPIISLFATQKLASTQKEIFHFSSHAELDISHANEIYELIEKQYNNENKIKIMQGLKLGMYYHKRLYSDIYEQYCGEVQ